MLIVFQYHSAYGQWVFQYTGSSKVPSAPIGSAHAGTEYEPQWAKTPRPAPLNHSGVSCTNFSYILGRRGSAMNNTMLKLLCSLSVCLIGRWSLVAVVRFRYGSVAAGITP